MIKNKNAGVHIPAFSMFSNSQLIYFVDHKKYTLAHMNKKYFPIIILLFLKATALLATEPAVTYKFYGFVRNDFYYNSRQNVEALDGLFNIFPKPIELNSFGEDKNGQMNAEMLSISTRLGVDLTSAPIGKAQLSAKIECDFAGVATNYYLIRLRQAYVKFNWPQTELLVGQTWHPMFETCSPTIASLNTGTPFQPFNRSPQLRLKQDLGKNFTLTLAAIYQMQYVSQGPNGASATYMKNAGLPNLFASINREMGDFMVGVGVDAKTIKLNHQLNSSVSGVLFGQYSNTKLQIKAKAIYGQNMSDHLMIGGYGVCGTDSTYHEATYTNFNTVSSWLNVVYGDKLKGGLFCGIARNLGTNKTLVADPITGFTAYGYGFYASSQELLNTLYRISPHVTYTINNIKFGVEYELSAGEYGKIQANGKITNPYTVYNHRVLGTVSYLF